MTNGIRASDFSDMVAVNFTTYSPYPIQNPNPKFYQAYEYTSSVTPLYTPPPTPTYQCTSFPTPPHVYHHIQPPPDPPFHFYTTYQTPYITTSPMLISDTTKCFLHQMDSKITQLDDKINQMRVLIEERQRVTDFLSVFKDEETVATYKVSNPYPGGDVWIEMEDKITHIIRILEKMGRSCENSSNLVHEVILGKEVEQDLPELVEDVLVTVDNWEVSNLQEQSEETYLNMSNLLPAILAHNMFDKKSEKAYVAKALFLEFQGTNSIIFSPKLCWKALKIDYDKVMLHELHENEYGKINYEFYKKFKSIIGATQVFDLSPQTKCDKVVISNLREDENRRSKVPTESSKHVGGILELGIGGKVVEIDEFIVRDKAARMMNAFMLVCTSGIVSQCELPENTLSRSLVVWNGEGEIMFYRLHEDEYGKVDNLVENRKYLCDSEWFDKGLGLDAQLKCSVGNGSWCKSLDSILCSMIKFLSKT